MAKIETEIELKMLPSYRRLAFFLLFLGNFCLKRFHPRLERLAERIMKAGMRYKSGEKWRRVF